MGFIAKRLKDCKPASPAKDIVFTFFCTVSGCLSLATWLGINKSKNWIEVYVLVWLGILSGMLLFGPVSGCVAVVLAVVGWYRLQDLVFASLDNVFGLTKRGTYWEEDPNNDLPVVINLWNIVQVILIFALGYQNMPGAGPGAFDAPSHAGPSGHFGFLYLSWTTLFPPGSGYMPITTTARVLVMAESISGLLIIVLTLAALLSRTNNPSQNPVPPPPPPPPGQ